MNPINGFSHRTAQRHGIGKQCATCGTTERKRSRPAGVALLAVVVAVLGTLLFPASARAEEGGGGGGHSFETPNVGRIIYGPVTAFDADANVVTEVGVTAYNRFDAAAYACGYTYGEVKNWSADIKAKLSNSDTGGQFYVFAQTFNHAANIDGIQWFIANVQYGSDLVWRSLYSDQLMRNALSDCQRILNGENIGGGSAGSSGYYEFDFTPIKDTYANVTKVCVNKNLIHFTGAAAGFENEVKSGCLSIKPVSYRPEEIEFGVLYLSSEDNPTYTLRDDKYYASMFFDVNKGRFLDCASARSCTRRLEGNTLYIDSVVSYNYLTEPSSFKSSSENRSLYYSGYYGTGIFTASTTAPVVPPTNWPDEPQAPEPPELPEPGTNPTVDPTPWSPVIDLPDLSFDLNITTDPTSDDILDWVKKIYYELKQFHRDAQQWFTEISYGFEDIVSAINNMNRQIYSQLQRMDSNVSSEFQQTRTYLHRLFHWLANQLDFDNDPYNDSNVIYWLKQIWSKLGGGINTRPTDPTSDPVNWWDWLVKAIQNFLIGLAATSSELISDFADVISQVMHQFPFSIPWDIAAFLAAFAAAPVTPEVTITIPAVEGWWTSFDYHISMSAFDTAAATIRTMEKILFAAFLAWKSRDLLDFMDVTKWFNG